MSMGQSVAPDRITIRLIKDHYCGDWMSEIVEHPAAISAGADASEAALNVLDALFVVLADEEIC